MKAIKTKVVHSLTKPAWNIVGDKLGGRYKIARVPYIAVEDPSVNAFNKQEALEHANFISQCFNNADKLASGIATTTSLEE